MKSQEGIARDLQFCEGRRNNCVIRLQRLGKCVCVCVKNEEIGNINVRKDAGFSKPFVKWTRTDVKLI